MLQFPQSHPYMMSFYLSGIGSVLKDWIKNYCKEEMQNILDIITKCINLKNMSCLKEIKS